MKNVLLCDGAPLPERGSYDALLLMGGPQNIYQHRDHPWLKAETRFLEADGMEPERIEDVVFKLPVELRRAGRSAA